MLIRRDVMFIGLSAGALETVSLDVFGDFKVGGQTTMGRLEPKLTCLDRNAPGGHADDPRRREWKGPPVGITHLQISPQQKKTSYRIL